MSLQIVIAWKEESCQLVRERRTDLGERPIMAHVVIAKTCMWLNDGTEDDVTKAHAYAATQHGYRVYTYPQSVSDPRAAASVAILADSTVELAR